MIRPGGECCVTVPWYVSDGAAAILIAERADWIAKSVEKMKGLRGCGVEGLGNEKKLFEEYKEAARRLVEERIQILNVAYGFSWNRIAIRRSKTRWGSCSRKKNLNFHFRLALLPLHLADYVIVHELCHLGAMNHGKDFWDLVSKTVPDWKERRKEIRAQRLG